MIHYPFFVLVQAIDDESFFELALRSMSVFSENSGLPVYAVTSLGNVMSNRRQLRLLIALPRLVTAYTAPIQRHGAGEKYKKSLTGFEYKHFSVVLLLFRLAGAIKKQVEM